MIKKYVMAFCRRGLLACGFGPLVLAGVYLVLQNQADLQTVTVSEVCLGIFSLSALAFIAGGMNVVYQVEQLPLMGAILIHGSVLYLSYLGAYWLNGWLEEGILPLMVFTAIFVLGYLAIWAIIYGVTKRKTEKLNERIKQKEA